MKNDWFILLISVFSGVIGTGIGGIVGALAKDKSPSVVGGMLAFAAGIMLGIVSFEMIPEATRGCVVADKKFFGALIAFAAVILGVGFAFLFNFFAEKFDEKNKNMRLEHQKRNNFVETCSSVEILKAKTEFGLKKAGIVMFLAIAFHNIPEGMAIGASGTKNVVAGIAVALIIALHNVPEGMAISAPLVSGGTKQFRAVLLATTAGASTLVGAIIGVFVGGASEIANGICMALASGAMIYVSCFDLLPISTRLKGEFSKNSFFFGLVIVIIFSLLF